MKRLETFFELVLLIALVAFISFKVGYIMATPPIVYTNQVVTVHSGDTIWSIAEQYNNGKEDTRDIITRIYKANNFQSRHIYPGQTIIVPVNK